MAAGWAFPSDWPLAEVDDVCAAMLENTDPGDALVTNSMNNVIERLPALGVAFTVIDVDDADFTPAHDLKQYVEAWLDHPEHDLSWIAASAGW